MEHLAEDGLMNLCRLCGEVDSECFDLFDQEGRGAELLSKIELSVRIEITEGDGLPTGICGECQEKLLGYTSFYHQCHDTQERLQEFLSIESAIYKTENFPKQEVVEADDYDEVTYVYEDAEEVLDEDEGADGVEGFVELDTQDDHPEQGEEDDCNQLEAKDDDDVESSLATTERKKTLPLRDPSSEQNEDIMNSEHMGTKENSGVGTGKTNDSPHVISPSSLTDVKSNRSVIVFPSTQVGGSCPEDNRTSNPIIVKQSGTQSSTLMPSSVLQILKVISKGSFPPPLVPIVKDVSKEAPPLVPIRRVAPPAKSAVLPTTKSSPLVYSSHSSAIPDSFKGKCTQTANVKLSSEVEPLSLPILKSSQAKTCSDSNIGKIVPIFKASLQVRQKIFERYSIKGKEPPPPITKKTTAAKLKPLETSELTPSPVLILKSNMAVKEPAVSQSKGGGRVFIMTGDKSVAVEVGVVETDKTGVAECKTDKVDKKRDCDQHQVRLKNIPYLILKNGDLVKLDDVENEVPLEQIPNPPVIVLHSAKQHDKLEKINIDGDMKFPESNEYDRPPVELGSGLLVRPFPADSSPSFSVSSAPLSKTTRETKLFVVQNRRLRQGKKKQFAIRKQRKRQTTPLCPEAASQVEDIPADPPQFKCKLCGALYAEKKRCEYHVLSKHMSENCAFECDLCGKKFATNFQKSYHRKTKHFRSPDYICSICGAAFRSLEVLQGHELRHAKGEAPFKCSTCGKGFYTRANCNKHQLDVHSEKKAICDVCGEAFSSNGRLTEHRWTHSGGLKCDECGKVFNSRSRFRAHKQVHKSLKFIHCGCGKKFATFAFFHNHKKRCPKALNMANMSRTASATEEDSEDYEYEYVVYEEGEGQVL